MFATLRYFLDLARFSHRADFVRMGYGIEQRFKRCGKFWTKHLELSSNFLKQTAPPDSRSITILGSGRLLDVDVQWLVENFDEIHLVDNDPSCNRQYKKLQRQVPGRVQVIPAIADVTETIEAWSERLRPLSAKSSLRTICDTLKSLEPPVTYQSILPRTGTIISLNLLSQLPLYFRDRADQLFKHFGLTPEHKEEVDRQLDEVFEKLQRAHVERIFDSKADKVVILSDTHFYYYRTDIAPWQVEHAVPPGLVSDLANPKAYTTVGHDAWLWHLAPQGVENNDYGEIHRVEAWAFERAGLS